MHILLTRPYSRSTEMKILLEEWGFYVAIEPVLEITPLNYNQHILRDSEAFIVTSFYASSQFVNADSLDKAVPIYAVGSATARPLREAGFNQVFEAKGDARDLLDLILKKRKPADGLITYLSGRHVTQDLAKTLATWGYDTQRVVVYQANPKENLSKATKDLLYHHQIDCCVFMSYRTAYHFTILCQKSQVTSSFQNMKAVVLSEKVASGLSAIKWKEIVVAETPTQDALLEALKSVKKVRSKT